jgi:hypothetical protein
MGSKCSASFPSVSKLRAYREEDVTIQLPSELTVFDIDWFAIFNVETAENFGSIIIPDDLNVPPSLIKTLVSSLGKYLIFAFTEFTCDASQ